MLRFRFLKYSVACSVLLSLILPIQQPAIAVRFLTELSYTASDILPPWDIPETGTGFFDFDGTTYSEFTITNLIFQNFETFSGTPLFPNGQTEPYPPNTQSLLTPIVFTPSTVFASTPTQFSAIGSLNFQTRVGIETCQNDPIVGGGVLCGTFIPAPVIRLDLEFDNPIYNSVTNQFLASNFSWSLTTTVDFTLGRFLIPASSVVGAGLNVETVNPFPGSPPITPVIPANRAISIPEPSSIFGLFLASGISLIFHRQNNID